MSIRPSFDEFRNLVGQGTVIPVVRELLADLETPVSVFQKLSARSPHAFLLESVEGGENLGRYSFIGVDPAFLLEVRGDEQRLHAEHGSFPICRTPIETLRRLLGRYKPVEFPGLPPFTGGAVGFLSYDTVRYYERIPDTKPDELKLPDCLIMVAETVIVFDHVRHRMVIIANAFLEPDTDPEVAYRHAVARIDSLHARLRSGVASIPQSESENEFQGVLSFEDPSLTAPPPGFHSINGFGKVGIPVYSNCQPDEYKAAVAKAKEYITAGDIFQVVLSQRFSTPIKCEPFDVYRALRAINPSPYMFYLKCGKDFQLAGSSPEILSKLNHGEVTVRPIAGTRPRGTTTDEDIEFEQDLLSDEKERAEHVMLVDLGRNDVGRVSKFGTVRVTDFMTIERYSHVMHIVSNVVGELADGKDSLDVLAATFPAGTLTGAPKIRAMEIIDELEKTRRGTYGGAVVYLAFNGNMDSCITIRTAAIKGSDVYVQSGAGIVADSNPDSEYLECVNKAMAMFKAIEMAEQGLD